MYYTLSTIPQVLSATSAVTCAVVFYRIAGLRELLVGDGQRVLNRWGQVGYGFPEIPEEDRLQKERLEAAVARKNIYEIQDVIRRLSEREKIQGFTKEETSRPKGLQYSFENMFSALQQHLTDLKKWTYWAFGFSFITIILSIICLAEADRILTTVWITRGVLSTIMGLFILSMATTFILIGTAFKEKTLSETHRNQPTLIKVKDELRKFIQKSLGDEL